MDKKELQAQLDALKSELEKAVTEKAKSDYEAQIKALEEKLEAKMPKTDTIVKDIEEIKQANVKRDAADKLNQAVIDEMAMLKKNGNPFTPKTDKDSFKNALAEALTAKVEERNSWSKSRIPFALDLKVVGDIGSGNFTTTGTQTFAGPTMLSGVGRVAYNETHMRDILGTVQVSTDSVAVIRGVRGEGAPTGVVAGAAKPQSDADWVKVIIPITKIAHHYTIPEEWLKDVSWLSDDITQTGIAELMLVEDNKIISNVVAGEFSGLVQNSTAYASPAGLALGIEAANNYDVLVAAQTQLRNLHRQPNFIVTDHDSLARMILTKATTGEYVFGAPNVTIPNVFGVPIYGIGATALADKFIVGDNKQAVVAVREGISVRFYDQHANNAVYNLVTVVIEERIALVVKRVDAFIYGDFSDARAALETA